MTVKSKVTLTPMQEKLKEMMSDNDDYKPVTNSDGSITYVRVATHKEDKREIDNDI